MTTKIKPVEAWALIRPDGTIQRDLRGEMLTVFAKPIAMANNTECVPVTILPTEEYNRLVAEAAEVHTLTEKYLVMQKEMLEMSQQMRKEIEDGI